MRALRPETTQPDPVAPADPVTIAVGILGVHADASQAAVKARYRALAKQWHPDLVAGDAAKSVEADARMSEINAAYAVICQMRGW
jgi:DnaJ-domain-containing protein 1